MTPAAGGPHAHMIPMAFGLGGDGQLQRRSLPSGVHRSVPRQVKEVLVAVDSTFSGQSLKFCVECFLN